MSALTKGYIQIYTGEGKGKTTAALGLALRAVGAGLKVYIGQFMKTGAYSEVEGLRLLGDQVRIEQFGGDKFIVGEPTKEDRERAAAGFARVKEIVLRGGFDVVILEEVNIALKIGLLPLDGVLGLLDRKPEEVEIVCTGRGAPEELIEAADLVTEMRNIKHYMDRGVYARGGIEK